MRRAILILLAVVVVVAAIGAIWHYLGAGELPVELVLHEADGTVTITRGGAVVPAAEGTAIDADDRIATGDDGGAVLGLGGETRIRIGPTSSLQIRAVDDDGVRVELEGGRIEATVRPESGSVRVSNGGREIVATNADFRAGVDEGVLQVESMRGEVALAGTDQTLVREGQQATIVDRYAALGEVPDDLLLDVAWPEQERTREVVSVVEGVTAPGAAVTIRGGFDPITVRADGAGRFSAEVALSEGDNEVDVVAVDALGRESPVAKGALQIRDTRGPRWQGGVTYED